MKLLIFLLTCLITVCINADNVRKIIPLSEDEYKLIEKGSRTLLSPTGNMVYFSKNKAVMIEDTSENVEKISIYIKHTRDLVKKDEKQPVVKENSPEQKGVVENYKVIPLGKVEFTSIEEVCRPWLSENGRLMYSLSNNAVIVIDKPEVVAAIEKFIRDLDKATPEVKYDNIRYNDDTYRGDSVFIYSDGYYWGGAYPYFYQWRRPYRPWPRPHPRPPRPYPPGPKPHPPGPKPHPPGPKPPGPRPGGGSEIRPGGGHGHSGGGSRSSPGRPGGGGGRPSGR